jgi:hypothetical protein
MIDSRSIMPALCAELDALGAEIAWLRAERERTTYRLEQALREQDRLRRHVLTLDAPHPTGGGDQLDRIC